MNTATSPQHMRALDLANAIRIERAAWKRALRGLERPAAARQACELILNPPAIYREMRICEVLRAIPRVGRKKTRAICNKVGVGENRTLGSLTRREAASVCNELWEPA